MDKYAALRELPFPTLASILGFSLERFKLQKEDWAGPCPIHQSKNNVGCFRYHESGKFHCFSCEAKGRGGLDLAMKIRSIGFKAAVELLQAYSTTSELAKEKTPVVGDSEAFELAKPLPLAKDTWIKYQVPCLWLEQRIPDAAVREGYGVFQYFNPARKSVYSHRVMIPVRNAEGILCGYMGRSIADNQDSGKDRPSPKYLFPKGLEKSRFLFGEDVLKGGKFGPAPLRVVYLLESPFSVMKFASLGLPAVSPFGWSVSEYQIRTMQGLAKGVVFLPDSNKAQDARSQVALLAAALWIRFPPLPAGIDDPEDMTKEQILAL